MILGVGAEPDRPGDRVRLRVRACGVRLGGGRVRVGDGQLQPRDRLHRLRHVQPPVLRAADGRGRPGGLPRGTSGGRDRPVRRPDAAQARAHAGGGGILRPGHRAGSDRPGGGPGKFAQVLAELDIPAPPHGEARTLEEGRAIAAQIGYPVVVRPSYVLGGRAMEIVYDADELETFVRTAAEASPDHPVLIDRFLEGAIEVDVDAVCGRRRRVHRSGDGAHRGSRRALGGLVVPDPARHASDDELDEIEDITRRLARRLGVLGLLNLQLAVKDERIWVLEANPRASRTVPFVSKAIGVSLARIATLVLTGRSLAELAAEGVLPSRPAPLPAPPVHGGEGSRAAVRSVPRRRHGARARDEVDRRGHGDRPRPGDGAGEGPGRDRARAPHERTVFVSSPTATSGRSCSPAKRLADLGFRLLATNGTAGVLERAGIPVERVAKVSRGRRTTWRADPRRRRWTS